MLLSGHELMQFDLLYASSLTFQVGAKQNAGPEEWSVPLAPPVPAPYSEKSRVSRNSFERIARR